MPCTVLVPSSNEVSLPGVSAYCFADVNAVLVYSCSPGRTTENLFAQIASAHGHFFARDIQIFLVGQPWLKIHIDDVAGLGSAGMDALRAPASAKPEEVSRISPGFVGPPKLLKSADPEYPPEAKQQGIQGTVLINGIVGKDGHLADPQALVGPPSLQQAALACVQKWVFAPSQYEGRPVAVEIDVVVKFLIPGAVQFTPPPISKRN